MEHGLVFTVELTITRRTALIAWSPIYTSRHMAAISAAVWQIKSFAMMSLSIVMVALLPLLTLSRAVHCTHSPPNDHPMLLNATCKYIRHISCSNAIEMRI
jgi:hypothetical protein